MCSSYPVGLAPSITSLSVTTGAVGAVVTITGTGFGATQGSGTVSFNGTAATVTSWSATSLVTTVPTGATTGNVVVFASGVNSNGSSFTVVPASRITILSGTTGAVGAAVTVTGNLVVTVSGVASNGVKFTALPTGWLDQDVGTVGVTGSATYANGTFTVKGAGTSIGGFADSFHFAYQPWSGDGTIIARLVSLQ